MGSITENSEIFRGIAIKLSETSGVGVRRNVQTDFKKHQAAVV